MKKLLLIASILFTFVSATHAQPLQVNKPSSLFDRLGGTEGITSIVDDVVVAHMNNPAIKDRFVKYKDQPEREFFSAGSGGPQVYNGKDMPTTHKGMNISPSDYMYVVDDIMMVLDKHMIDEESKKDVLAILWSLKGMIIGK